MEAAGPDGLCSLRHLPFIYLPVIFIFLIIGTSKGKQANEMPRTLPGLGREAAADRWIRLRQPFRNIHGAATRSSWTCHLHLTLSYFFSSKKKKFKKKNVKSTHNTLGEFSGTSCRCYGYFHLIIILAIQHICNPCGKL